MATLRINGSPVEVDVAPETPLLWVLRDTLGLGPLPGEDEHQFTTVAGFVLHQLGRIPHTADHFDWDGLRFEVVDMDGRRVDKVLVSRRAL